MMGVTGLLLSVAGCSDNKEDSVILAACDSAREGWLARIPSDWRDDPLVQWEQLQKPLTGPVRQSTSGAGVVELRGETDGASWVCVWSPQTQTAQWSWDD